MRIVVGCDHAGFAVKQAVLGWLAARGHAVEDRGTSSEASVDYPDYAHQVASAVAAGDADLGILLCGTGLGMSMAANKVRGVRAAVCHDAFTARMARAHNDANVLCVGSRVVGLGVLESIVDAFLDASFEGGRHARRVAKIDPNGSLRSGNGPQAPDR